MPRFERWTVVSVPFPYVERPVRQRRPALVVSAGPGAAQDLVWVPMITAAADRGWPDDVAIDDHAAAGLPIPSIVRTAKIATTTAADAQPLGVLPAPATAHIAQVPAPAVPLIEHRPSASPASTRGRADPGVGRVVIS